MRNAFFLFALCLFAWLAAACGRRAGQTSACEVPDAAPSMYYWRTSLRLDSVERRFLTEHRIGKLYVRFFDVVKGKDVRPVPSATLTFDAPLPDSLRIIPVVFLTEGCLHADTTGLADRIVERVAKMTVANHLSGVRELQIDCDWTPRSRASYFALLASMRRLLALRGWRLSVTVRLHQLSDTVPPADYGVLMLYNTGDMRSREARNPIFDTKDIEPYLRHLPAYALPLCAAYPNFRWPRLFSGERFKGLLYSENLADSTVYEPIATDSLYRVVQARTLHGSAESDYDLHLSPGDEVVVSRPTADEVLRLARRLETMRPGLHAQTIFYHLDHNSIPLFTAQQYETFYHLR